MAKTFGPYFQDIHHEDQTTGFMHNHYDILGFCSGSLTRDMKNRNIMGRVHNNLVAAINQHTLLPKVVLLVFENDWLRSINHQCKGISTILYKCLHWLANEIKRLTVAYKEKLPTKSRKFKYPHFMLVPAVYHDQFGIENIYHEKFNDCLQDVLEDFREMSSLELHTWDRSDFSTCGENGQLTSHGNKKYWIAVNDAYQAWDKQNMKQYQQKQKKPSEKNPTDKYHWVAPSFRNDNFRKALPKPPCRC